MNIAVNTRFLLKGQLEGYGHFIREILERMVNDHRDHQFYFLFDRPFDPAFVFGSNVHPLVVSPPARLPLLWKYWYDIRIPLVLKKIRADVFISPDGYCSLSAKAPQLMVVHDLGFLRHPQSYKGSHVAYLKRNTPKFLKKAKRIITVSEFSKKDILHHYKIEENKIQVVHNGVRNVFHPAGFEEQGLVKDRYTNGCEFFMYLGAIQPRKNLINLLKAFSIFKKRLQSNMKLVLAGKMEWKNEEFYQLLKTYKYRDDVVLTGYLPDKELAPLLAAAYAFVYPSYFEGFGVPVAEALRSGVPVLTSAQSSMEEVAGEAALYFDPNDHNAIAEQMMLIYKDEDLRKQLIERGKEISAKYDWNLSAGLFWQSIVGL